MSTDPNKQHKKKRRAVIVVLLIALIGALVWLLFFSGIISDRLTISPDNLFPFGDPSDRQDPGTVEVPDEPTEGGIRPDEFIPLSRNRLRLVASVPVAGFQPMPTNAYYQSQESLIEYNQARGETPLESLPELRVPYLWYSLQENGSIMAQKLATTPSQESLFSAFIPRVYESFFTTGGEFVVSRFYDRNQALIETFIASMTVQDIPFPCEEIPTGLSFSIGESHVALGAVKDALTEFYNISNHTDSDTFDAAFQEALAEYFFIASTATNTEPVTEINPEDLAPLKQSCEAQTATLAAELPLPLTGSFIDRNIEFATLNSDEFELLAVYKPTRTSKHQIGLINTITENKRVLFDSYFGEWIGHWANEDTILLHTKASHGVEGHIYALNSTNGRLDKILADKPGLVGLMSPDGEKVLYSHTNENTELTQLGIHNISTQSDTGLPFRSLTEKCTWSSDSRYVFCGVPEIMQRGEPDRWYQGLSVYSDTLWMYDTETNRAIEIYDPLNQNGQRLDIYKITLDPFEGNYLYFLDKQTNYLWSLEIDGIDGQPTPNDIREQNKEIPEELSPSSSTTTTPE